MTKTYTGSAYNFILQAEEAGANLHLTVTWGTLPANVVIKNIEYAEIGTSAWVSQAGAWATPKTFDIPASDTLKYRVTLIFGDASPSEEIPFTLLEDDVNNEIAIPFINPVKFFQEDLTNLPKYYTKHFDDYEFQRRLYTWQQPADYHQPWQTTDIIYLQFESTADPIIFELLDMNNAPIVQLPALIGIRNRDYPNMYSFEATISLAAVTVTGCYRIRYTAGTGSQKLVEYTPCMYISTKPIPGTLLLEYYNNKFYEDVMFETGIKFQKRVYGSLGRLFPKRKTEASRDQRWNPTVLSAKTSRQFPVQFGGIFGLPDDEIDCLNRIWGCSNVRIDNKEFTAADAGEFEYIETENYPKYGVKLMVEEGINRKSKFRRFNTDPTKRLMHAIMVDKKVFGDTGLQDSSNAVPIITIE